MFNDTFLSTLDAHAPIKSIWIRSRPCPYLTPEIKDQMTFRQQHQYFRYKPNFTTNDQKLIRETI